LGDGNGITSAKNTTTNILLWLNLK